MTSDSETSSSYDGDGEEETFVQLNTKRKAIVTRLTAKTRGQQPKKKRRNKPTPNTGKSFTYSGRTRQKKEVGNSLERPPRQRGNFSSDENYEVQSLQSNIHEQDAVQDAELIESDYEAIDEAMGGYFFV